MYNELYDKINKFIKENIKAILLFSALYFILTHPLPYSIYTAGGIIDVSDKVTINDEYKKNGTLNLAYVSELKGTVSTVLLSYIMPDWDLIKRQPALSNAEDKEDIEYRDRLFLKDSIQNATIYIYNKLNKVINVIDKNFYVVYVDNTAVTDLNIGDEILEINGIKFNDISEYISFVNNSNYGDELVLKIKTKERVIKNKKITVLNYKNNKITGIYIVPKINFEMIPKITYNFSESESGPSGGLMLALTIYNKLTQEDITKGKRIVGTGTIDIDGNVGEISGIEYKLKGAVNQKADIFLVPMHNNYKDAIKLKEKYNYNITIIGVSTFNDALNYLLMM